MKFKDENKSSNECSVWFTYPPNPGIQNKDLQRFKCTFRLSHQMYFQIFPLLFLRRLFIFNWRVLWSYWIEKGMFLHQMSWWKICKVVTTRGRIFMLCTRLIVSFCFCLTLQVHNDTESGVPWPGFRHPPRPARRGGVWVLGTNFGTPFGPGCQNGFHRSQRRGVQTGTYL